MVKSKKLSSSALITGASQRIGKGIALKLASMGYNIALHCNRSVKEAQSTLQQIEKKGKMCKIFQCDLSDESQTQTLIKDVCRKFPDLNVLINNASVFEKTNFKDKYIQQFNRHFAINLKAPYVLTFEFKRLCKKGNIINLLDTNIIKNKTSYFSYLLTKKSLADLTRQAAVELAPDIRVNGIAPGLILPPADEGSDYLNRLAQSIPLKRKGKLEHIQQAVEFLLKNDYLTGQIIYADGGEHLGS